METTEKGMKIVVTRAQRGTKWEDIPMGMYFASMDGKLFVRLSGVDANSVVSIPFGFKQMAHRATMTESRNFWEKYRFHVFESFTEAAKWVSNGRKLEDLGGDGKDEWEQLTTLGLGDYFTDNGCVYMIQNFGLGERSTATVECWHLEKSTCVEFNDQRMVWPIDFERGDTITITWG